VKSPTALFVLANVGRISFVVRKPGTKEDHLALSPSRRIMEVIVRIRSSPPRVDPGRERISMSKGQKRTAITNKPKLTQKEKKAKKAEKAAKKAGKEGLGILTYDRTALCGAVVSIAGVQVSEIGIDGVVRSAWKSFEH
jgi:hypothetical protein